MNHWIVVFEDHPELLTLRETHFKDHVAYLTSRPELFVDGTGLSPEEGAAPTGGMWIVQATDRADIVKLIEGDPMYRPELRSYQIFATGKRLNAS